MNYLNINGDEKLNYLQRANEIYKDLVEIRRHIHQHPELGYELPETAKFVKEKLAEYGIEGHDFSKGGVTAVIGKKGGKTILLRADMDALPIIEKSGLDFASKIEGRCHACGHDIHPTILLGAARLLKENEDKLEGQVKFIFQPAEELLTGGGVMVDEGILENPKVDAAMGLHVWPHADRIGIGYNKGVMMSSANNFRIKIKGIGSHGSMPYLGVDPVFIGAKIVTGVPELIAREIKFDESAVVTMGKFVANGAINVIPAEAVIEGTVRTFSNETREYIKKRLPELVSDIAKTYRGEAELEFLSDCPVLINNTELAEEALGYLKEIDKDLFLQEIPRQSGSEDFAYYANKVPAFFFVLQNPVEDESKRRPLHHPEVLFNEEAMPLGVAALAQLATRWLEDNK